MNGKAAVTLNNAALPEWQSAPSGAADLGRLGTSICPLQVRDSHAIMILLRRAGDPMFDRGDIGFATKFAVLASHALAARHANRSEAERAHLHRLTRPVGKQPEGVARAGGPRSADEAREPGPTSRNGSDAALAKADDGGGIALAFIDLDNFKKVNDVHGHAAGDALLKAVADRVRRTVRTSDLVGRISGDEFVVLFESRSSPSSLAEFGDLARRLGEVIREPYDVEGARLSVVRLDRAGRLARPRASTTIR